MGQVPEPITFVLRDYPPLPDLVLTPPPPPFSGKKSRKTKKRKSKS